MTPLSADAAEEKKVGDLRLERVFSFSSISSGFLFSKKFDFGKVFTHGIPYLSRDEEAACREEYNQRADNLAKLPYIPIRLEEPKTLAFYRRARRTIQDWLRNPTVWPLKCHDRDKLLTLCSPAPLWSMLVTQMDL
jgi:hypothetical protein